MKRGRWSLLTIDLRSQNSRRSSRKIAKRTRYSPRLASPVTSKRPTCGWWSVIEAEISLWHFRFDGRSVDLGNMSQSPFSKTDRSKALLDEGLAFHKAARLSEAERCYLAALEMEKNNVRALTFLGTLHVQRGEYEKATRALRQSLRIN